MNTRNLIRWTGVAAMAAGIIFASIQPIHPPDVLASVTTSAWAIIQAFKLAMCVLFVVGITGLYARQVEAAGWLGLAGYVLFSLSWVILMPFVFIQALVNPLLATASPAFVESFLGIVNGHPGAMNIGALPALYNVSGLLYALGGLVFGIATFRAGILPRRAGALLAIGAVAPIVLSMLPHPLDRTLAVPMGLAMAWLGWGLLAERRAQAAEPVPAEAARSSARPPPSNVGSPTQWTGGPWAACLPGSSAVADESPPHAMTPRPFRLRASGRAVKRPYHGTIPGSYT